MPLQHIGELMRARNDTPTGCQRIDDGDKAIVEVDPVRKRAGGLQEAGKREGGVDPVSKRQEEEQSQTRGKCCQEKANAQEKNKG